MTGSTITLTDPDTRPKAHVVIYDGDCRFCQKQVARLSRLDLGGQLSFLSLHDPRTAARYPDLSHDQLMDQMYVVDSCGGRHGGAAAIRYLSRQLPLLWPLAPLLHLPGTLPLWSWLYHQVAVRRYRWGRVSDCDSGACAVHLGRASHAGQAGSVASKASTDPPAPSR